MPPLNRCFGLVALGHVGKYSQAISQQKVRLHMKQGSFAVMGYPLTPSLLI